MKEKNYNTNHPDFKIPVSVVFLGPPASGKGTTASYLENQYNIKSISPGNIFKKIRNENSELSKLVIESTKDGGLCPDWLTNEIVKTESLNLIKLGAHSITLDGFPRTKQQLDFLNNNFDVKLFVYSSTHWMTLRKMATNRRNCKACNKVFSVNTIPSCYDLNSDCALISKQNWETRWDDHPDFFAKRYKTYKKETLPVIQEVSKYSNFIKIDLFNEENYEIIISLLQPLI